jgi:hypothetical protein
VIDAPSRLQTSNAPDFEAKKNRILELYDLADGKASLPQAIPTSSCAMTSSDRSTSNPPRAPLDRA